MSNDIMRKYMKLLETSEEINQPVPDEKPITISKLQAEWEKSQAIANDKQLDYDLVYALRDNSGSRSYLPAVYFSKNGKLIGTYYTNSGEFIDGDMRPVLDIGSPNIKIIFKAKAPINRYRPDGSEEIKDPESSAVVYKKGLTAIAYRGRKTKREWNYRFSNESQMNEYIERFFNQIRASEKFRDENDMRKTVGVDRGLEVGDIMVSSWGYDQTNLDWYQVVGLIGNNSAVVRKIRSNFTETSFMAGTEIPEKDHFIGPEIRVARVKRGSANINGHSANKWDGKPKYSSHYA